MRDLYTEQDLASVRGQLKRRLLVLSLISAVFLTAIVLLLLSDNHKTNRPEALVTVLTVLLGFTAVFFWDLLCRPLRCYARHLNDALHGRSHEVEAEFCRSGGETSTVDGIVCSSLIFLGEADKHGDRERLFYWDAQLRAPSFTPGSLFRLRYYDRFIVGWEDLS